LTTAGAGMRVGPTPLVLYSLSSSGCNLEEELFVKRVSVAVLGIGAAAVTMLGMALLSGAAGGQTLRAQSCYPSCIPPTSVTNVLSTTPPSVTTPTVPSQVGTVPALSATTTPSGAAVGASVSSVASESGQAGGETVAATETASGGLAFTGSDIVGMVVVALLLLGGGALFVGFARRRTESAPE
jgi:hypothetical protein